MVADGVTIQTTQHPYAAPVVLDDCAAFLEGADFNEFSQFGEDGLIEACLSRFGIKNEWCFEVGAYDGVRFSNVKRLWDKNWNAVLIEGDADLHEKCRRFESGRVRCVHEHIEPASLDRILAEQGAPKDLDFGVIDIDGQDYWILDYLKTYRPRLLLVEFWPTRAAHEEKFVPPLGGEGQAAFEPLKALGESKGYVALAKTKVNILFCDKELL